MKSLLLAASLCAALCWGAPPAAKTAVPARVYMYVGTLDHKLLMFDEEKEEVAGEIPLGGIPRVTVLSRDQTKLYIITTQMEVETVDLVARQMTGSFSLADEKSHPRMVRGAFGRNFPGVAVDPAGRYLYTTMRVAVKDIDQYRLEPPQFVVIDLQDKKITKTFPFPKELDQGFGFTATYKVSPDGKLLYVFDQDIVVYDLSDFHQVDRMEFAKPLYPGASPYRLAANDDPNDDPRVVTSVFTSVDPIVHKETLGLAKLDLLTRKIDYKPIGPALPMVSFMLTPDRKFGYSLMFIGAGANRRNEFWMWDIDQHKVIQRTEFPSRFNARFSMSSDGKKLFVYGAGSTIEVFDAKTLTSKKLIYLNKDTTTNLIALAKR